MVIVESQHSLSSLYFSVALIFCDLMCAINHNVLRQVALAEVEIRAARARCGKIKVEKPFGSSWNVVLNGTLRVRALSVVRK